MSVEARPPRALIFLSTIVNELLIQIAPDGRAVRATWKIAMAFFALFAIAIVVHAQDSAGVAPPTAAVADNQAPLVIEGVSEVDVFSWGQTLVVRGDVKHGAMAFGGDVIVEGRVQGDVAAIGGSVIQREGSYIGGDVIVFGGAYHHGKSAPERNPASTTVMFAGNEKELRGAMRDPATLLAPRWSPVYLGQRLLAVLFWFIVSLALTAITPGAVSRAVARLQLTDLRVAVIGFLGAVVIAGGGFLCLKLMPPAVGVLVVIMASLLLLVAYLFGRVVIHAATGRWLERLLLPEGKRSESIALLLGAGFWVIIMSLPYVWPLIVTGLLVTSLGLALTARYRTNWKPPRQV